jgi:hypothetical protein
VGKREERRGYERMVFFMHRGGVFVHRLHTRNGTYTGLFRRCVVENLFKVKDIPFDSIVYFFFSLNFFDGMEDGGVVTPIKYFTNRREGVLEFGPKEVHHDLTRVHHFLLTPFLNEVLAGNLEAVADMGEYVVNRHGFFVTFKELIEDFLGVLEVCGDFLELTVGHNAIQGSFELANILRNIVGNIEKGIFID